MTAGICKRVISNKVAQLLQRDRATLRAIGSRETSSSRGLIFLSEFRQDELFAVLLCVSSTFLRTSLMHCREILGMDLS